uniref:Uncharacterized protein n=1 Tax=Arundo donax TaxID=35708 RepID=A0A0A9CM30_ARUDO
MKEIRIPASILQYTPKQWYINSSVIMRSLHMEIELCTVDCCTPDFCQTCSIFCNSASQYNSGKTAKESCFVCQPKIYGEPEPESVNSNEAKPSERVCSKLEKYCPAVP